MLVTDAAEVETIEATEAAAATEADDVPDC
jgi:hypothetical protein